MPCPNHFHTWIIYEKFRICECETICHYCGEDLGTPEDLVLHVDSTHNIRHKNKPLIFKSLFKLHLKPSEAIRAEYIQFPCRCDDAEAAVSGNGSPSRRDGVTSETAARFIFDEHMSLAPVQPEPPPAAPRPLEQILMRLELYDSMKMTEMPGSHFLGQYPVGFSEALSSGLDSNSVSKVPTIPETCDSLNLTEMPWPSFSGQDPLEFPEDLNCSLSLAGPPQLSMMIPPVNFTGPSSSSMPVPGFPIPQRADHTAATHFQNEAGLQNIYQPQQSQSFQGPTNNLPDPFDCVFPDVLPQPHNGIYQTPLQNFIPVAEASSSALINRHHNPPPRPDQLDAFPTLPYSSSADLQVNPVFSPPGNNFFPAAMWDANSNGTIPHRLPYSSLRQQQQQQRQRWNQRHAEDRLDFPSIQQCRRQRRVQQQQQQQPQQQQQGAASQQEARPNISRLAHRSTGNAAPRFSTYDHWPHCRNLHQ